MATRARRNPVRRGQYDRLVERVYVARGELRYDRFLARGKPGRLDVGIAVAVPRDWVRAGAPLQAYVATAAFGEAPGDEQLGTMRAVELSPDGDLIDGPGGGPDETTAERAVARLVHLVANREDVYAAASRALGVFGADRILDWHLERGRTLRDRDRLYQARRGAR